MNQITATRVTKNRYVHHERVVKWLLAHKELWRDEGLPRLDECQRALKAACFSPKTALCDIHVEKYIRNPRLARWIRQ